MLHAMFAAVNRWLKAQGRPLLKSENELASQPHLVLLAMGIPISADINIRQIEWEVLPPGTWPSTPSGQYVGQNKESGEADSDPSRIAFFMGLGPEEVLIGQESCGHAYRRYMAFVFSDYVVAECAQAKNAIYVVPRASWREMLSLSKLEARKRGAIVVTHQGNWPRRLLAKVS